MNSSTLLGFAAALICCTAATSQRTWIVDSAGGPGVDFSDLPPAVAAATPGDTILVRDGMYAPFTTDKGIRVLGSRGTLIFSFGHVPIVVHDLPAGDVFVMERCSFLATLGFGSISLLRNAGAVHLEHSDSADRVIIQACAQVSLTNLRAGHVDVVDSVVAMSGINAMGASYASVPVPTLSAIRSTIVVGASRIDGPRWRPGIGPFDVPNGPAATLDASRLVADSYSALHGGDDAGLGLPMAAILATNSVIELDANTIVTGESGAPPIVSDRPVTIADLPALLAEGDGPGGNLAIGIAGPALAPALIAISVPASQLIVPTIGDLFVDAHSLLVVFSGAIPSGGSMVINVPVPNDPLLRGTPITAQGLVAFPAAVRASSSATVVLH